MKYTIQLTLTVEARNEQEAGSEFIDRVTCVDWEWDSVEIEREEDE